MAMTVLDSGNLEAVLADAQGAVAEAKTGEKEQKATTSETQAADKKDEAAEDPRGSKDDTDPDDVEGEDGLTARQKKELSSKMLKAIGKKHRQVKEAEEFAAAQYSERKLAEERAQKLQAALDAAKGAQPAQAEKEITKPKREDYATESEFIDASVDFRVGEKLKEEAAARAKEAQERATAQLLQTASERIAKAIDLVPDFKEITQNADVEVPPAIAGYMQKSEMFAELGYHLAKNPELVVSLAKLPPDEQLVKIGKIEGTLQPFSKAATAAEKTQDGATPSNGKNGSTQAKAASETNVTTTSKARNTAPVIQPLSTNGATVEKDPEDMDIREMISDFTKRNGVNLTLRKRH
jgi:hypothetical protein